MPFDASGIYSRPFTFVQDRNNGLKILATRMDAQLDDYKMALDRTFLRDGSVALSGNLDFGGFRPRNVANGTAAAPGYSFKDDTATGLTLIGAGILGLSAGGLVGFSITGLSALFTVPVTVPAITLGAVKDNPVYEKSAFTIVADGASITLDFTQYVNPTITLAGSRTLANPANLSARLGQSGTITIKQDATGSRTLAYGSYFKWPDGSGAPALSTAANAVDEIAYIIVSATEIRCTLTRNFS